MAASSFPYKERVGFIDAQRYGSLLIQARMTVLQRGRIVGSPIYGHVSVGSFTIDRNSEFRRTGEITLEVNPTIPPSALMPTNPYSLISPFGTEVFFETGIVAAGDTIPDQSPLWIPNGLFVISTTAVDDTGPDCTITLQMYDRAWTIAQRVLKQPWGFPHTTNGNFVSEIQLLLSTVWNEQQNVEPLQFNIVPTGAVVPIASYNQGSDPWQAALDMASAVGYELFFDRQGIVVGRPIPNPYDQPVTWYFTDNATYVQGNAGTGSTSLLGGFYSTPVEVQVKMTRDGIHNDVVVQGVGTGNSAKYNGQGLQTQTKPILAEAQDLNPLSPTYVNGAMGDVPKFMQSSMVTSGNAAQDMASNDLNVALSTSWTVTLGIAPNPDIDVNDIVQITRPRVGLNNAICVLDTVTHTFNYADIMYVTGRVLSNNNSMQVSGIA